MYVTEQQISIFYVRKFGFQTYEKKEMNIEDKKDDSGLNHV